MVERRRPVVVSARVTRPERIMVEAAAEIEGVTVSELLHRLAMPRVREIVTELATDPGPEG